ncbi:replication-relaxation family protein [uncultured Bradyrhizobium sp.]|uniref:replication-relaxation family protein n=1 Tax=uncultured Bradyrhizobium sp. TaxID=199684 RepID=UPI0035CADF8C
MKERHIETFKLCDRYRYVRSNFIAAYHGTSAQHRKRELGPLTEQGYLRRPSQQKDSANYRYSPKIYELGTLGKAELRNLGVEPTVWKGERHFWHQLMVADFVLSIEICCRSRGLRFRHRRELLGSLPVSFSTDISFRYPSGKIESYSGRLQPDDFFAINDTYFALEADRENEPITRLTLQSSSYARKLLQYREVLIGEKYKQLFPNLIVLNITTSPQHAANIMTFMDGVLGAKSKFLLFKGIPILASRKECLNPLTGLLDEPFDRVGYEPYVISQEV